MSEPPEHFDLKFEAVDCKCEDRKKQHGGTTLGDKADCASVMNKNVEAAHKYYAQLIAELDGAIMQAEAKQGDTPSESLSDNQKAINKRQELKSRAEANRLAFQDTQIFKHNLHSEYPDP